MTDSIKIYNPVDMMPSGHGSVSRGHVKNIIDYDNIELTVRTHQAGWNDEGFIVSGRPFADSRFKNKVITSDRLNKEYLINSPDELRHKEDDLVDNLGSGENHRSCDCPIRDFSGKEDVWHTIGGMEWVPQAPDDPDIATVMETDYKLDQVPHKWVE